MQIGHPARKIAFQPLEHVDVRGIGRGGSDELGGEGVLAARTAQPGFDRRTATDVRSSSVNRGAGGEVAIAAATSPDRCAVRYVLTTAGSAFQATVLFGVVRCHNATLRLPPGEGQAHMIRDAGIDSMYLGPCSYVSAACTSERRRSAGFALPSALRRFVTAAEELGLNHTTITRRIAALEQTLGGRVLGRAPAAGADRPGPRRAGRRREHRVAVRSLTTGADGTRSLEGVVRLSATDGFSAYIAAPAAAQMQRRHPRVTVEIVTATRRASQQRSGLAIEVVVGEPRVRRAVAKQLGDYRLGLYGSRANLSRHGSPATVAELARHRLVYFIDSMLQVDDLDLASSFVPASRNRDLDQRLRPCGGHPAAAGLGLLPCFMADRHDDLVRVLPHDVAVQLSYWLVAPTETLPGPSGGAGRGDHRSRARDGRRSGGYRRALSINLAAHRLSWCSHPMPFIEHNGERIYYRHWAAAEPRAAVVFLHGFGEHTGLYHRYGFALNAAGIDLWAVARSATGCPRAPAATSAPSRTARRSPSHSPKWP